MSTAERASPLVDMQQRCLPLYAKQFGDRKCSVIFGGLHCPWTTTPHTVDEGPTCCSLNAIMAQFRNCPFGVNTTIEQKNFRTVSDSKGI